MDVQFPPGYRLERLGRQHRRSEFRCGDAKVDGWLATKAWQHQEKHLSVTKVLIKDGGGIAGYYTLATGQIDFGDLPPEVSKGLPRRMLPVAVLAWLGVDARHHRQGLGGRLLAQALRDCWEAGATFPFIAVILDCTGDESRAFYKHWEFKELPGHPYRLFLSAAHLAAIVEQD